MTRGTVVKSTAGPAERLKKKKKKNVKKRKPKRNIERNQPNGSYIRNKRTKKGRKKKEPKKSRKLGKTRSKLGNTEINSVKPGETR